MNPPKIKKPNVVKFQCPRCGVSWLQETNEGAVDLKPPTCGFGHKPTEMEQRLVGSDEIGPTDRIWTPWLEQDEDES